MTRISFEASEKDGKPVLVVKCRECNAVLSNNRFKIDEGESLRELAHHECKKKCAKDLHIGFEEDAVMKILDLLEQAFMWRYSVDDEDYWKIVYNKLYKMYLDFIYCEGEHKGNLWAGMCKCNMCDMGSTCLDDIYCPFCGEVPCEDPEWCEGE